MTDVKKRIVDYHGRIENINLYNTDPYPARKKDNDFKKEPKPRVPPHSHLEKLLALKKEKEDLEEKDAKAQKAAEGGHAQEDDQDQKKDVYGDAGPDPKRFDILEHFDFPEDLKGGNIVHYDSDKLTLFDIFQDYGTEAKPKQDPKQDPEPPKPKEKVEKPPPVPVKKEEENKDEEEKEGEEEPESPSKLPPEEEEVEEVFIPPVEKVLWYDFDAYDGKDPVLLALMQRW